MFKMIKALFAYFKEIGWKKYLLYLLITILSVAAACGLVYAASLLFRVNTVVGIIGVCAALLVIFLVQYFIMKRTEKKRNS